VLRLAVPTILANLTQPILSSVDVGISGHLSDAAALGGVALASLIFNMLYWSFGFLRMSTTGLVAQHFGAKDAAGLRATLARALLLAFCIGSVAVILQRPLINTALTLIGGTADVRAAARSYCLVRIWGAPAALANLVVLGYLLGRQKARVALVVQIFINITNMAAALLFVYGLNLGVAGLGGATLAADLAGFCLGGFLLWRLRPRGLIPLGWAEIVERNALVQMVAVNRDIFARSLMLLGCFAWFAHEGAGQGDVVLAANAVLLNLQSFVSYVLDGVAQAAEALVGATIGEGNRGDYRRAIRVSTLWAAIGATLFSLFYAIFGPSLIRGLTNHADVRGAALTYLPWAAALPLIAVWCFQLDGIFIGATRGRDMRNSMVVACASFAITVLALRPIYGNHGLWAALMVLMIVRGLTLGALLPRIGRAAFAASA
jgi:MATE family multidrug resistance protein